MKKFLIGILVACCFVGVIAYNVNQEKIDEQHEVLVVAFLPLTGPLSSIGTMGKNGIETAINQRNKKLNDKNIVFNPLDTKGDPKEAITLFHGHL